MDLFKRAPLIARLGCLDLVERLRLERVFVDVAGVAPLSVDRFRRACSGKGISGNAKPSGVSFNEICSRMH